MNIYNIKKGAINETSGISINIYLSGCHGYCKGCHSAHTWDFNAGSPLIIEDLIAYLKAEKPFTFDHICILGGEPLDHPEDELIELFEVIRLNFPKKPLWLYTHHFLEDVSDNILENLDYIKTGRYIKELPEAEEQHGVFLASRNQIIFKLENK